MNHWIFERAEGRRRGEAMAFAQQQRLAQQALQHQEPPVESHWRLVASLGAWLVALGEGLLARYDRHVTAYHSSLRRGRLAADAGQNPCP